MSILFDFLTEQIFSFISGQVLDHAYTSARLGVRLKYTSNLLNEQMNAMEKKYRDTVIDTDCFFAFYKNHKVSQSIWDLWHNPETDAVTDAALIQSFVTQFDTYRISSNLSQLSALERSVVTDFLQHVSDIFQHQAIQSLSDESKVLAAAQAQDNARLKQELLDEFKAMACKKKSSHALPFQKKFHKKLFLETADAPTLANVYVWPDCQVLPKNTFELLNNTSLNTGTSANTFQKNRLSWTQMESLGSSVPVVSALSAVSSFIEKNDSGFLIIEGVAGSGKSSLMCALSTVYDHEDCYFLSLKDLIDYSDKEHRTDFKNKLWQYFGLNGSDYGKTLFLDGYDELHSHLDAVVFRDEIQSLINLDYKIIMTTRPGYLEKDFMPKEWQMIKLQLFSDAQIQKWLEMYRIYHKDLHDETVKALLKRPDEQNLDEIRRIPIMLYVIANRNINVGAVSCMGDLYAQVFDNLKRDKAGETKDMIERHYHIAQKMAYHMSLENDLCADEQNVRQWCGDMFDESFFSSVYIENSIIEGTKMLEFVHKTILEFFAAKWIYNQLWKDEEEVQKVLAEAEITSEILAYIQYFYAEDVGRKEAFDAKIINVFENLVKNGIIISLPKANFKLIYQTTRDLFENLCLMIKFVINKTLLNEKLISGYGLEIEKLFEAYYIRDHFKVQQGKSFLTGENFDGLNAVIGLDWSREDLSDTKFFGTVFRRTDLQYGHFDYAYLRDAAFEYCNLTYTSFDKAVLEQVRVDQASLINASMIGASLKDIRLPKEHHVMNIQFDWSEIISTKFFMHELVNCSFDHAALINNDFYNMKMIRCTFDHASIKNTKFEKVRFINCDFSNADLDDSCSFMGCRFDNATKKTNPQLLDKFCRMKEVDEK